MAILVVDLMHGLEPQTIESLNMLRSRKTPFVVALNKVDRLYDWKGNRNKDITDVLKSQSRNTKLEFEERTREVVLQFAEQVGHLDLAACPLRFRGPLVITRMFSCTPFPSLCVHLVACPFCRRVHIPVACQTTCSQAQLHMLSVVVACPVVCRLTGNKPRCMSFACLVVCPF